MYRGLIDNIQLSWVKVGEPAAVQLLQAGCNDLGGTLMDENISRAAGAAHGQEMTAERFAALVAPLGRQLVQRTTTYGLVDMAYRRHAPRPGRSAASLRSHTAGLHRWLASRRPRDLPDASVCED